MSAYRANRDASVGRLTSGAARKSRVARGTRLARHARDQRITLNTRRARDALGAAAQEKATSYAPGV